MTLAHYKLEDYQCEDDRKLIYEIINLDVTVKLMNWIRDQKIDEVYNSVYRSSFLELNDQMAPRFMEVLRNACEMFEVDRIPPVYLVRDFDDTVSICGIAEPFLVISSRYLELLQQESPELMFGVIAGQVAGIQAGHHRGLALIWLLDSLMSLLPVPQPAVMVLDGLLNDWKRCRMYTCDRAMYLAMGDYPLALRAILSTVASTQLLDQMHLGESTDGYKPQVEAFLKNSVLDDVVNMLNSALSDTGWLPLRYHKLAEFAGKAEQEDRHGS